MYWCSIIPLCTMELVLFLVWQCFGFHSMFIMSGSYMLLPPSVLFWVFVLMFPNENNGHVSIIYIIGITEQTRGSCLLCVVYVLVLKLVLYTQSKVFTIIS